MFPTEPALLFPWASLVVDSEPMTLLHHDEGLYQPNTSFASLRHPATPCCRHPATPCDTLRQSLRQSLSGENRKFRSGKVESSDFRGRARAKPAIPSSLSRVSPIAAGSRHGRARVARRRAALGNGLCKGRYDLISVALELAGGIAGPRPPRHALLTGEAWQGRVAPLRDSQVSVSGYRISEPWR